MLWLLIGVSLWIIAHGFKPVFPEVRQKINDKLGEDKGKGLFALGIFASVILIIYGWRHSDPSLQWYTTTNSLITISWPIIALSIYLIVGSTAGLRMRKWVRHPQLNGVALLSIAHLLTNGEVRSILLFGGLALWSIILIPFINHRDGPYKPPTPMPAMAEWKYLLISGLVFLVLVLTHGFYTAQSLIG